MVQKSENLPENQERQVIEWKETKNTHQPKKLEGEFLYAMDEYIEEKLNWDVRFFSDDSKVLSAWRDFTSFLWTEWRKKFEYYIGQKDTYVSLLKHKILQESLPRLNLFHEVQKKLTGEYRKIKNNKEKSERLKQILSKSKPSYLKTLLLFQTERQKFLLKNALLKKNEILQESEKDELETVFKKIFWFVPENFQQKQDRMEVFNKIKNFQHITIEDVQILVSDLPKNQKAKILHYFYPKISFTDAIKLEFFSDKVAKNQIWELFQKYFSTEAEKEEFLRCIDYSSFFIDTSKLSEKSIDAIFWDATIWNRIVKDYNDSLWVLQELVKEETTFLDFQDFLQKVQLSKNILPEIKNQIHKLKKWGYIDIFQRENEKTNHHYFYISNITDTQFYFTAINKWANKISKSNQWLSEEQSLSQFFESLLKISQSQDTSLKIFDAHEFQWHKQENNIEDIPDVYDETLSLDELKKVMKDIDPKYTWEETSFCMRCKPLETQEDDNTPKMFGDELFEVSKIDTTHAYIKWQSPITLWEFAEAFTLRKPKRFPLLSNSVDFFNELKKHENYTETLKDFELKDNKVVPTGNKEKSHPGVEYFVSKNGKNSVRIIKMSDGSVNFEEGDFSESPDGKKPNKFEWKISGKGIDYNSFYLYLSEKNLQPYTKNLPTQEKQEEEPSSIKRKRSLFKSYMWCLSLAEIISGSKQIISSIEQSLQTGNKLKSAKFALAMWKYLPQSVREDLQAMVEWEEKKTMEELLSHLTTLDSKVMIPKIERILLNASSQQYEIEAALFAMLSKYGTLYNKNPLNKHRGSFIWYEALGWKKWDALYMETKRKCEESRLQSEGRKHQPKPFSEEFLIEELLALQADGKMKPKRRSKIHKEMGAHLDKGIKDELDDGQNKAGDKVTLAGRIEYCIGELKSWWYANALWALEKVWWKWWDSWDMHVIPFVITSTGIAAHFHEKLLIKLTSGMGWSSPYTELMFNKDPQSIKKFQKWMKAIIHSLYPNNPEVLTRYEKIWSNVEEAYSFWNEYGKEIVHRMTGRDGYLFAMKEENLDIKNYYEFLSWMQNDNEYNIKPEQINDGVFNYDNTPVVYTMWKKVASEFIQFNQAWIIQWKTWGIIFDSFLDHLKNIKKTWLNEEKQFELFFEIYSTLEPIVRARFWGWEWGEVMRNSPEVKRLKTYGIDLIGNSYIVPESQTPSSNTIYWYIENESYKDHVRNAFERFKNIRFDETDFEQNITYTQSSIGEILNRTPANQENYRQAA